MAVACLEESTISISFRKNIDKLQEKVSFAYTNAFNYLSSIYWKLIQAIDWCNVSSKLLLTEEDRMILLDEHMEWLCSVANDCDRIISNNMINVQVNNKDLSSQGLNLVTRQVYSQFTQVCHASLDYVSCIIYKIVSDEYKEITIDGQVVKWKLNDRNFYDNWQCTCLEAICGDLSVDDLSCIADCNINSIDNNGMFINFITEIEEYILERIDFFNDQCYYFFLAQAADNIIVIYLTFLKTCHDNKRSFQPESNEIKQMIIDIKSIRNSFNNLANKSNINQAKLLIASRFDRLNDVIILINSDIMSEEFTKTVQSILKLAKNSPNKAVELSKFVELCIYLRSDHERKKSIYLINATSKAVDYTSDVVNSAVKTFKRSSFTGFFKKGTGEGNNQNNKSRTSQKDDDDSICAFFIKQIHDCKDIVLSIDTINNEEFPLWKSPIQRIIDLHNTDLFTNFISTSLMKSMANDASILSSSSSDDIFKNHFNSNGNKNTIVLSNIFIRNLFCLSQFSKPSCYLQFTIMGVSMQTKARNETLHPNWRYLSIYIYIYIYKFLPNSLTNYSDNEDIELSFTGDISHNMDLFVTLFYKGLILSDDKVGLIKIPLSHLLIDPINNMSYNFDFTIFKKALDKAEDEKKRGFELPYLNISIKMK
jgi:hypothetical protein